MDSVVIMKLDSLCEAAIAVVFAIAMALLIIGITNGGI